MSTTGATQIACGLGGSVQRPSIQTHRPSTQSQRAGTHTYPGPGAGTGGVVTTATGGGGGTLPTEIPKSTCAPKMKTGPSRSAEIRSNLSIFIGHLRSSNARYVPFTLVQEREPLPVASPLLL